MGGSEDNDTSSTSAATISPEEDKRSRGETAKAASSFSGRVEFNGSWRKRPEDDLSTDQKIGYGTGSSQSPTWGCTVLIDTGSTSTIIKEQIGNCGRQSQVKLCTCVATTVAVLTPLSGELVLSLKGLSGKNRSVVAHVMDCASNENDATLGTDALRCVKGSVQMRRYDWIVRLGTMRYRSEGGVSRSRYVGAAVVKKMDHISADNVTQHFEAVFHTEGEPLSVTGRVRHGIVIPDDRVVRSEQEHVEHLVQLLRRHKKFGLKFSREKTMFFQPSVKFLGYVVSERGIHSDPGKVVAIKKLQVPVDMKGVRAIERELLGVVWAVEYFRPYLWGRQFLIKTDHKPLVWFGGLKETSARVACWKERLAAYSFTISHNKGKDNVVADCLSMVNALDTPTPSPGPSRRRPRINGPEDSTGDLSVVTPTPEKPLEVVEADLVFLDGATRLTLIDRLTRIAYKYPLQA
ncbi:hypothetical protein AAG570_006953 [Ranatra chinensis]|uniref:Reverse transcriptase RNase H-like domain-containing protein n=1 Tax=Ranatra chinensis TaxID=642074 RepID=A0ABD0YVK0_9HEMI